MFSISLSKGLISILQHHFQDNFSDQFSRHVLPFLRGVTHFWWQWIDYKETWGEYSAFGRLTRIWWGLGSSPRKHQLLSFPSCPSIRNENDGHIWLRFLVSLEHEWLTTVSSISQKVYIRALLQWLTILGAVLGLAKKGLYSGRPLNHRQIGSAGQPRVSPKVSWPHRAAQRP